MISIASMIVIKLVRMANHEQQPCGVEDADREHCRRMIPTCGLIYVIISLYLFCRRLTIIREGVERCVRIIIYCLGRGSDH